MTTTSTPRQRLYREQGYIIVENLLPPADFQRLDEMIDRLLDGELKPAVPYQDKLPESFYTFWEPGLKDRVDLPRRQRVRLMSWMGFHHPYFWQVNSHPAIVSVVAELFGTGVKLFSDTVFMKPARHGIEAAMHQDTAFWPRLRPNALNFWLAVDRATRDNGCLHLIPGTHHHDLPHDADPVQRWILPEERVDVSRQIAMELPPNAALFMDSALVHRSYPNRSDHSRRAWTAIYVSDQVEHLEPWNIEYQFKSIPLERTDAPNPTAPAAHADV